MFYTFLSKESARLVKFARADEMCTSDKDNKQNARNGMKTGCKKNSLQCLEEMKGERDDVEAVIVSSPSCCK